MKGSPKKKGIRTLLIGLALFVLGFVFVAIAGGGAIPGILMGVGIILLLVGLALWGDGVIKERKEKKKAKATDN